MYYATHALLKAIWGNRDTEDYGGYDLNKVLVEAHNAVTAEDGGHITEYFIEKYWPKHWPEPIKTKTLISLAYVIDLDDLVKALEQLISGVDPDDVFEY